MNPLLDFSGLPRYADIQTTHVTPAVEQLLAENRALVTRLTAADTPPTWADFVQPLTDANERLSRAWGQVSHLHAVLDSPELREAYNANLPRITQYYAELGQHEGLFRQFRALAASPEAATLSAARRRILENELRDFRLGGAELPADEKPRFMAIQEELAKLSARFEENLLDATKAWSKLITEEALLEGVPDDTKALFAEMAAAEGHSGWKLNLQAPSFLPIMQFCANRALREEMYRAYVTRASEFGPAELDNTPLIARILELRREAARLLGFDTYAQVSLEPKMAGSPAEVLDFLDELARRAKPYGEKDMIELRAFAASELNLTDLQAWDTAFASERLRESRYAYSENEVKQYFQEPRVLAGLFRVIETLYGLEIRADQAPVWHEDVKFFAIQDRQGRLVGRFYLDLHARDSKRSGAWMDDAITRRRTETAGSGGIQTPVAYLNCNNSRGVGGKPALMTHDDVITLFHEFGHGLHHLLTQVEDLGVSGIHGVEWDAVELPSQFMENFCWEWDVVRHMSAHVDTGEQMPRALFDRLLAARNFQAGMQTLRQIEFALFDMHLHHDLAPGKTALELLDEIRAQVAVVLPPHYNRFPNTFSHIFAGGYAAGYYSYKWAEVLSADAYSLFEESTALDGVLNPDIGQRFWREVLAWGGARPALESFKAFRGREPSIDALLRHSGME
ncbi:MAG TPA: M3 family metallopeptidase [Thiobacillaceae bacterium]|nr:M3 family metallopeptidase [Thiobacillaceae bacterium]HNU64921.1 M3 family metallopeptidase [Thiobacillaceae bacterium]